MPISIGSNISSLRTQRYLNTASAANGRVYERLSSGLRINRASDDAAGLAVSASLGADARIYGQAIRNLNDGASVLGIAEGALTSGMTLVDRLRELATQSANGSYSLTQRRAMSAEADALVSEFNRTVGSVNFNGLKLLNGQISQIVLQGGRGANSSLSLNLTESLLRTVGNGSFTQSSVTFTGTPNGSGATGDFNGDGINDLVIADDGGTRIMIGSQGGTFTNQTLAAASTTVAVGDLNNDGKQDILAYSANTSTLTVLTGNGTGNFVSSSTLSLAGISRFTLGDFDSDGDLDGVGVSSSGFMQVRNNGNGVFSAVAGPSGDFIGSQLRSGDFNGDGKLDIAAFTNNGAVETYLGNGAGAFSFFGSVAADSAFSRGVIGVADLNRDGYDDLVVDSASGVSIYRGGQNGFTSGGSITLPSFLNDLKFGDANGDGFADMYVSTNSSSTRVQLYLNDGAGNLAPAYDTGQILGDDEYIEIGDFNGDGAEDFFSWEDDTSSGALYSARGTDTASLSYLYLLDREGALSALGNLDAAANRIKGALSDIGSGQSRLSAALAQLSSSRDNVEAARSRIVDADVAEESSQLTRTQILQQTATAVLAQANQAPSLALQLLRGS